MIKKIDAKLFIDAFNRFIKSKEGQDWLYQINYNRNSPKHPDNNDLTKICFNYACDDLDRSKDRCKRDKVCDMQIRKSSLES